MNELIESRSIREESLKQTDMLSRSRRLRALERLDHWPEYMMEAAGAGAYTFFACTFSTLLQHPASPLRQFLSNTLVRRVLYGLAMGGTLTAFLSTPWARQSGGHLNPAITATFYRLDKVEPRDALFYVVAQFLGATCGVVAATCVLRGAPGNSAVRYAVTVTGTYGEAAAFIGEAIISFVLMITILFVTNSKKLAREYESSAIIRFSVSRQLLARDVDLFRRAHGGYALRRRSIFATSRRRPPYCAKLDHANNKRCIFSHSR